MSEFNWLIFLNIPFNILGLMIARFFYSKGKLSSSNKVIFSHKSRYPTINPIIIIKSISTFSLLIITLFIPLMGDEYLMYLPLAWASFLIIRMSLEFFQVDESRGLKKLRYILIETIIVILISILLYTIYGLVDPISIMNKTFGQEFKITSKLIIKITVMISLFYLILRSVENGKSTYLNHWKNTENDFLWSYVLKISLILIFFEGSTPFELFENFIRNSTFIVFASRLFSFLARLLFLEIIISIFKYTISSKVFGKIENSSEKFIMSISLIGIIINLWL